MELNEILQIALRGGASDIHLKAGLPPMFRVDGALVPLKDGKRLLPNGDVFKIEFLIDEPSIQPHHAPRLGRQLARLDLAARPEDMNVAGWRLHPLSNGHWSVWVNGNWRMTFAFEGTDAILVDYQDYH